MSEAVYAAFLDLCRQARPEVYVVLGSGLGVVAQRIEKVASVGFIDIPGLPATSVVGHRGQWTLGRWGRRSVLVSEGRFHFYEGHTWEVVTRPIQLAAQLGVRISLLTNAAGGIRDDLGPGSLMPIRNHLEWNRPNPWRHTVGDNPYSTGLLKHIVEAGMVLGLPSIPGVYGAVTGPSYETPAEIRALQVAGADAVGMSTSQEVLAGFEAGLECAAVSIITNRAAGLGEVRLSHEDVLTSGTKAAGTLADLIELVLERWD